MSEPRREALTLTRRRLLTTGAAALTAIAAGPVRGRTSASAAPSGTGALPSVSTLWDDVQHMVDMGARYPGSAGHDAWVDHMQESFERYGVAVTRDRGVWTRWAPLRTSLSVDTGPDAGQVVIAAPYPYSGKTGPDGVQGQLAYLGPLTAPSLAEISLGAGSSGLIQRVQTSIDAAARTALASVPGGVAGKIVVVENPVLPLVVGVFDPLLSYRHDPDNTIGALDNYSRVWTTLLTATALSAFREAGAVGAVLILDASPENAVGQFVPFTHPFQNFPALIVDRKEGVRLRRAAQATANASLQLQATVAPTASDSLVGVLPGNGSSDEALLVHTHTDGMNAFEENGSLAQLYLADHFSSNGPAGRTRDIVFSSVTGHFGPGLPETQGFIDAHPDIVARTAASVTIEHFGATEWIDDGQGYHPTGQVEPAVAFHSNTRIVEPAIAATRETDLRRFELLEPLGNNFFGVGAKLHQAGIPGVAYIGGPNYLCAERRDGHIDKLDPQRMSDELDWTVNLLRRLDTVPAAYLRAP